MDTRIHDVPHKQLCNPDENIPPPYKVQEMEVPGLELVVLCANMLRNPTPLYIIYI